MANVFINDENLTDIANAIRSKNNTTTTYLPSEMAAAINNLYDISDATATENDIKSGISAYTANGKVTGTLVTKKCYTGSTQPDDSIGEDGDLYIVTNS